MNTVRRLCAFLCILWIWSTIQISVVQAQYGSVAGEWKISYDVTPLRLGSKSTQAINITIYDVDLTTDVAFHFEVHCENTKYAFVEKRIERSELNANTPQWQGSVEVQGRYFGYTQLYVTLNTDVIVERSEQTLDVTVLRENRADNRIFTYTAAGLVLLMFVNLGSVLDLKRFFLILLRPIGPLIGFISRYIIMPALGLGLGYLLFRDNKNLQLALFFTALAPSGGLANICTVFLKGNINLSIATTTINSLLALAMLPLWIMVLARVVYDDEELAVPFLDLAVGAIALIAAISVGIILRACIPKTTRFLFRFLKPLSVLLSLCLIGFTVGINAFIFKELTWMIFLAALLLPIIGYLISYLLSKILCRSATDALTIGIETSVLNMTVPIVLLQYSLEEPTADMVIVVPIMAALISLVLFLIFYIVRRIFGWNKKMDDDAFDEKQLIEQ